MTGMRKFARARQTVSASIPSTPMLAKVKPAPDPIIETMDEASANIPRLLTPEAVAEMLGVTERTLERWRITGKGPRYAKLSRSSIRYQPEDIATFVADRLRANTAQ